MINRNMIPQTRVKIANGYVEKELDTVIEYDCNAEHRHNYLRVGKSWYECKYIGSDIEHQRGIVYWRAVRKVSVAEVRAFEPEEKWCGTGGDMECMDLVMFETLVERK